MPTAPPASKPTHLVGAAQLDCLQVRPGRLPSETSALQREILDLKRRRNAVILIEETIRRLFEFRDVSTEQLLSQTEQPRT